MKRHIINAEGFIIPYEPKTPSTQPRAWGRPKNAPKLCAYEDCTGKLTNYLQQFCKKHAPSKKSTTGVKPNYKKTFISVKEVKRLGVPCRNKCGRNTYNEEPICTNCYRHDTWKINLKDRASRIPVKRFDTTAEYEAEVRRIEGKRG